MAQVLFGQSYYLKFDPKLWRAMQPYPPLGTLYAASYLTLHGYDVALFDAMLANSEEDWRASLSDHQPEFAILFEDNFNYLSKMCLLRMRSAACRMIEMAKTSGCKVILCGADATDHPDYYLAQGADYVLLGEGEETLVELLDRLTGRTDLAMETIRGLAYKDNNTSDTDHRMVMTGRRPDISNLDALPFPAWHLIDVEKYRAVWLKSHGYFSMNMVTTRGCPYHCNWCAKPIWGQRYHSRSPENVVTELSWLKKVFHPDHIWFADDILGLTPGWISKFSELVRHADAIIPFKCLQRADLVTDTIARALALAGCKTVWVGAESGSQKILDAMEKGETVEDIYHATRRLHSQGIEVGLFLQFGYPGESKEDIQQTMRMVWECKPDDIGISVAYPLPGTKFHQRVKKELGEKQNWIDSDDLAMLYRGPFPQEFYRLLHWRIHSEFRARRALLQPSLRSLALLPLNIIKSAVGEFKLRLYT